MDAFIEALELFRCLLGVFLGLLRLSLDASRAKKCRLFHSKTIFCTCSFSFLEALDWPLVLTRPLLEPICSQNGPPNGPQSGPNSVQRMIPKTWKILKTAQILALKWVPKCSKMRDRATGKSGRRPPKNSWSQDASKMAQAGPKWPRIASSWAKKVLKRIPRWR